MKKCPHCGATKSLSEFGQDRTRGGGGYKAWCKPCTSEDARARRLSNPEKGREASRKWAKKNPEMQRERAKRGEMSRTNRRHAGPDEWARLYAAQDGHCYLCRRPFQPGDKIHVDHDHDCCKLGGGSETSRRTESCQACRRGLAHEACNQIIGLAGENMDILRAIAIHFPPVRDEAKERIAAKQAAQLELVL